MGFVVMSDSVFPSTRWVDIGCQKSSIVEHLKMVHLVRKRWISSLLSFVECGG